MMKQFRIKRFATLCVLFRILMVIPFWMWVEPAIGGNKEKRVFEAKSDRKLCTNCGKEVQDCRCKCSKCSKPYRVVLNDGDELKPASDSGCCLCSFDEENDNSPILSVDSDDDQPLYNLENMFVSDSEAIPDTSSESDCVITAVTPPDFFSSLSAETKSTLSYPGKAVVDGEVSMEGPSRKRRRSPNFSNGLYLDAVVPDPAIQMTATPNGERGDGSVNAVMFPEDNLLVNHGIFPFVDVLSDSSRKRKRNGGIVINNVSVKSESRTLKEAFDSHIGGLVAWAVCVPETLLSQEAIESESGVLGSSLASATDPEEVILTVSGQAYSHATTFMSDQCLLGIEGNSEYIFAISPDEAAGFPLIIFWTLGEIEGVGVDLVRFLLFDSNTGNPVVTPVIPLWIGNFLRLLNAVIRRLDDKHRISIFEPRDPTGYE